MNLYKLGLPNSEQFYIKEIDNKILIHRKQAGVKWDNNNKYFRSSVWDKESGDLISAGFRAFVNYGEQPDFEPLPVDQNEYLEVIRKLDGSLIICSIFKGELIVRTRGTVDASKLENGHEIELLKKKYPKAFDNHWLATENYSLLFEWTTPTNRIVLQESEEPTLWLIGMVYHGNYSYALQKDLDHIARDIGVERPRTYPMFAGEDIELLQNAFKHLNNIEGIVVYTSKGQILKKIKTLRYLELHRVFTGIKSVDHLFEWYLKYDKPTKVTFEERLANDFDWELVATLKPLLDELYGKLHLIEDQMFNISMLLANSDFMNLNRKDKAQRIIQQFPDCSGIAFNMLDGRDISFEKIWKTFTKN